jgi:hypothetical protein
MAVVGAIYPVSPISSSIEAVVPLALVFEINKAPERISASVDVPGEFDVALWRITTMPPAATDPAQAVPDGAVQIVLKGPPPIENSTTKAA